MGKNLINTLKGFLKNFDAKNVNEYFVNGEFLDDCVNYFENAKTTKKELEVLDFLTERFYDIDVNYRETEKFEKMVKETIEKAIEMLN